MYKLTHTVQPLLFKGQLYFSKYQQFSQKPLTFLMIFVPYQKTYFIITGPDLDSTWLTETKLNRNRGICLKYNAGLVTISELT